MESFPSIEKNDESKPLIVENEEIVDSANEINRLTDGVLLRDSLTTFEVELDNERAPALIINSKIAHEEETNVILVGRFGQGKSSLINFLFGGMKIATVGHGMDSETKEPTKYKLGQVSFIDTPGLESDSVLIQPIFELIRALLLKFPFHAILFVQNHLDLKLSNEEISELRVWRESFDVPIILVLNQTNSATEKKYVKRWHDNIKQKGLENVITLDRVVPLGACEIDEDDEDDLPQLPRNIEHLAHVIADLPIKENRTQDEKNEFLGSLKRQAQAKLALSYSKRALIPLSIAVPAAGAVGLSPVPFLDQVLLIPILVGMAAGICVSFKAKVSRTFLITLIMCLAGVAGLTTGILVNVMKVIPIVNIAAMILDGAACSGFTLCIGLALIVVLRGLMLKGVDLSSLNSEGEAELTKAMKDKFSDFFKSSKSKKNELLKKEVAASMYADGDVKSVDPDEIVRQMNNIEKEGLKKMSERRALKEALMDDGLDEDEICIMCFTNQRDIVTSPCGHTCYCNMCFNNIKQRYPDREKQLCALCRTPIESYIKKFVPKRR